MKSQLDALHLSLPAPAVPSTKISAARLTDVAHQFEASLMKELMTPFADDPLGGDQEAGDKDSGDHDASMDALGSFARESMAKALSAQGGFGIARTILHYFEKTGKVK